MGGHIPSSPDQDYQEYRGVTGGSNIFDPTALPENNSDTRNNNLTGKVLSSSDVGSKENSMMVHGFDSAAVKAAA